jgi:hypothetical protein
MAGAAGALAEAILVAAAATVVEKGTVAVAGGDPLAIEAEAVIASLGAVEEAAAAAIVLTDFFPLHLALF